MVFERLKAELTLDTQGFQSGVNDAKDEVSSLGDRAHDVGRSMQKSGGIMSAGITAPLSIIGKKSLDAAADAEELRDRSEAVFDDMTDDVHEWADQTAEDMGRSENQLLDMATTMQDMIDPTGEATEETMDLSMGMAELAEDVGSFQNMESDQVMDKFMSAMAGQSRAVRDLGVDMSAAAVEQELLNQGIEGGTEAATDAEEAQARYNILMEDTQAAHGDAARTADTFTGASRRVRARLSDLAAEMGQHLLPVATLLAQNIDGLIDMFDGLSQRQQRIVVAFAAVAAAIGPVLLAVGTLLTLLPTILAGVGALGTALAVLTGPIGLVVLAIGALTAAWMTDFMGIRTFTEETVDAILSALQPYIDILRDDFIETFEVWQEAGQDVLSWFEDRWDEHGDSVMAIINPFLTLLETAFEAAFEYVSFVAESAMDALTTAIRVGLAIARGDFEEAFDLITEFLDRQIDRFKDFGSDMMETLASGIKDAASVPVDAVEDAVGNVRDRLPSSPADKGPLADLDKSGEALMDTPAKAAEGNSDALADPVEGLPGYGGSSGTGSSSGGVSVSDLQQALEGMSLGLSGTLDVDGDVATLDDVDARLRREARQTDNRGLR